MERLKKTSVVNVSICNLQLSMFGWEIEHGVQGSRLHSNGEIEKLKIGNTHVKFPLKIDKSNNWKLNIGMSVSLWKLKNWKLKSWKVGNWKLENI